MTSIDSNPPNSFEQRLHAANTAWQSFIKLQDQADAEASVPRDLSMLCAFSRFLHELIPDSTIRGQLLRGFEQDIHNAASLTQEVLQ